MDVNAITDLRSVSAGPSAKCLSFFERLPYDVRAIIYNYMEQGNLPPITRGFQPWTSGFILSCRFAKQDLEDLASINLTKFLVDFKSTFERTTSLPIHVSATPASSTLAQLRHLKVTIPFTSFHPLPHGSLQPVWKREVLIGLHPLFAHFFDKVHIHFSSPDNMPACDSLHDRGCVEVCMHSLLRDITYMIERVNREKTSGPANIAGDVNIETIFKYQAGRQGQAYPSARVNAKRICLSWDLREANLQEDIQAITLNGKLHRNRVLGIDVGGAQTVGPNFYHLRDGQRVIGEMGIISDSRWELSEHMRLNTLVNAVDTHCVYCHSKGLGKELGDGLVGCSEKEFEEDEEHISRLLYDERIYVNVLEQK